MIDQRLNENAFLTALKNRLVVFDGAMGTNLESQNLTPAHYGGQASAGCNDILNLTYPSAIEIVHSDFLEAGVDAIETNTFRANRFTLTEFGLADQVRAINLAGARLARNTADKFSTRTQPRFVAGSMGPSGILLSIGENSAGFDDLKAAFREQASALIEGGVDLLLLETSRIFWRSKQPSSESSRHLKVAANGCRSRFR